MCGIIFAANYGPNDKSVNQDVSYQLQDQISRGKEGFGGVYVNDKMQFHIERACEMTKVHFDLFMNQQARMVLFHHRMPTSSPNRISQTHPIKVTNANLAFDYYVIHNGVISNYDELKKKHEELDYDYVTEEEMSASYHGFNDSECLAIEVARYIEGKTEEIGALGSAAFITLQVDKLTQLVTKVYFGRNDRNPLKIIVDKGVYRISSEGKGEPVEPFKLFSFNTTDYELMEQPLNFYVLPAPLPAVKNEIGFQATIPYHKSHYHSRSNEPEEADHADQPADPTHSYLTSEMTRAYEYQMDELISDFSMQAGEAVAEYFQDIATWQNPYVKLTEIMSNLANILKQGKTTAQQIYLAGLENKLADMPYAMELSDLDDYDAPIDNRQDSWEETNERIANQTMAEAEAEEAARIEAEEITQAEIDAEIQAEADAMEASRGLDIARSGNGIKRLVDKLYSR